MALLIQTIPPLQTALGAVDREIHILGANIVDVTKQMFFPYEIKYFKDGEDISKDYKPMAKPFEIHNGMEVYVRDENFNPIPNPAYADAVAANQLPPTIPNPEYVDEESTPDTPETIPNPDYISDEQLSQINEFLHAPAYDCIIGSLKEHPELIWTILSNYIMENYADGWYDNRNA